MLWRTLIRPLLLCLVLCVYVSESCIAQSSSFEFWPEADIWYRLSPGWRFSAFVPITKYNESKNRDINIYLHADYSWGKTKHFLNMRMMDGSRADQIKGWMVRGGFMEGWSLGEEAGEYTEDMLFAEIHRRTPLNNGFLLSSRIRTDLRWVGQDPTFSYRFRYRVMLEKELKMGRGSIVPYMNVEPFWDSRYSTFNRVRAIGGATLAWGSRFAYEGNITYQYDEQYNSTNMFALNFILHVYFQSNKMANK